MPSIFHFLRSLARVCVRTTAVASLSVRYPRDKRQRGGHYERIIINIDLRNEQPSVLGTPASLSLSLEVQKSVRRGKERLQSRSDTAYTMEHARPAHSVLFFHHRDEASLLPNLPWTSCRSITQQSIMLSNNIPSALARTIEVCSKRATRLSNAYRSDRRFRALSE